MNCQDVSGMLHVFSDGELDLVRHVQIEEHLAACAACAEREQQLRALRTVLSSPSLYYQAPTELRTRVERATAPLTRHRRQSLRQMAAMAAGVLLLIGTSATIGAFLSRMGF